jgi:hypothetical protein
MSPFPRPRSGPALTLYSNENPLRQSTGRNQSPLAYSTVNVSDYSLQNPTLHPCRSRYKCCYGPFRVTF